MTFFHGAINAISYRSLQTFDRYDALVDAIRSDYKYTGSLKDMIRESLCKDLKASPRIDEVSHLLASPTGELFLTSDCGSGCIEAILESSNGIIVRVV